MIAGALAKLSEPVDEPIDNYHDSGQRAVDVDSSIQYLDGHRVQNGTVAGPVKQEEEIVDVTGHTIEVERRQRENIVASEWLADVEADGWIMADRTYTTEEDHRPPFPFSLFETRLGVEIQPMYFDVEAFVKRQREHDRSMAVEMASIEGSESEDVRIDWGKSVSVDQALQSNVGTAMQIHWRDRFIRLVIYESGYTALWSEEDVTPVVGRFVHEELAPIAVTEAELEEDDHTQAEVTGSA
jgi:hypothetical protein